MNKTLLVAVPAVTLIFGAVSCASRKGSPGEVGQVIQGAAMTEDVYSAPSAGMTREDDPSGVRSPRAPSAAKRTVGEGAGEKMGVGEKTTIPVVEPRKIEPRKAYVEPAVRIKIFGDTSTVKLRSSGALTLSFGENTMKVPPDSPLQFRPRTARVAVRSFAVGIATYDAGEYAEAVTFAERWQKEGYTVRLIKAGGPLVQADGTIADTTVYWVALGIFKEKKTAERFRDKLYRRGVSCWVIDESLLGPRGNIEVADGEGHARAYADSRITVTCAGPITILGVPFGHGFWSSGNRENRIFASPIDVIVDKRGGLAVVNKVKLEDYIKGVVPVEIRLDAHEEALKAQAVAARTEALAKLGIHHVFDPYDFCASQHCQEYGGLSRRTKRTDAAVDDTRGQVLMRDGSMVDAVYSANCGGHTEHNEYVWSSRPDKSLRGVSELYSNPEGFRFPLTQSQLRTWLRSKPRAYCGEPRVSRRWNFRWKLERTAREINAVVNQHREVGSIKDIKVLRRGVSGRAIQMRIVGARDTVIINKELQIRRVLGGLKSSMFIVDIKRDSSGNPTSFVFDGGGWGHGVGMCQEGAEGMALRGFTYGQILRHYYSGVELKRLYE